MLAGDGLIGKRMGSKGPRPFAAGGFPVGPPRAEQPSTITIDSAAPPPLVWPFARQQRANNTEEQNAGQTGIWQGSRGNDAQHPIPTRGDAPQAAEIRRRRFRFAMGAYPQRRGVRPADDVHLGPLGAGQQCRAATPDRPVLQQDQDRSEARLRHLAGQPDTADPQRPGAGQDRPRRDLGLQLHDARPSPPVGTDGRRGRPAGGAER